MKAKSNPTLPNAQTERAKPRSVQRMVGATSQSLTDAGWVKQSNGKWRHDGYGVAHLCKTQAEAYQWLKTSSPNSDYATGQSYIAIREPRT